jgi:elongation factor G
MPRDLHEFRNIGIIAHIDAGKTTLTEQMLYLQGFSHRVGEVDKGTTVTDFDPEEQERGITINAACVTFPWRDADAHLDININLVDTPGHVDFTAEVERSLRVLDGAVVVFSAREGVEAQSETVWHQADKYHVPRIAFINKMDREGADFYRTLQEIQERLNCKPLPINVPIGSGPSHYPNPFRDAFDLIDERVIHYLHKSNERVHGELYDPGFEDPDVVRGLHEARSRFLDQLSMYSDELTELLLAEQPVPKELIIRVLRSATIENQIVPVLCGSALTSRGIGPVLDAVARYLPSPADIPPVEGTNPKDKKKPKAFRKPAEDQPFCGLVFKIQADRHGDLHYVRVYSGVLKAGSRALNPVKDKKENVPQLWRIQADRREQVERAGAGDIVGIVGLKHSVTGDTLCDPHEPIVLETITFPETVISMAIEPESSAERKKLADVLEMMKRQDPTFRARENEETGQTLISGMGELHLEVIQHRLTRDYGLAVRVHKPRVSYRETIQKAVDVSGNCHRNIAGQNLSAALEIRMEPFQTPPGLPPVVVTSAAGDSLPEPLLAAALETLSEQGQGGGSLGFPLMHVKITVLGGTADEQQSNELAFRLAAADAFNKGLREGGVVLLEPIMRLEITVPEENLGDIVADLQQRRAVITRTQSRGRTTVIDAQAPLAKLFGYSNAMRGLSQGRATCTMEPSAYGPAPQEVLETFL